MRFVLLLSAVCLLLTACDDTGSPVVAAAPPAQTDQLSIARAAVDQLKRDNAQNPEGPARQAVDLQAGVAQAALPAAKPEHADGAAELSALVFAGKLDEALKRAVTAEQSAARFQAAAQAEREAGAARLREVIAQAERDVRAARAAAEREAYLRVVSVFALIGAAITIGGIVCAVTGWSRIGVLGIPAGILVGGSGLLWGRPWFLWTIGGALILGAIAGGIFWAVRVHEARARTTPAASAASAASAA